MSEKHNVELQLYYKLQSMAQTSAHPSNRKDQLGKLETQESGQCNIYNLSPLDWFNWKDTNQLNWCTELWAYLQARRVEQMRY